MEYIHTDALGTPVAVTDASRNVIERSEYEPYGALLNRPITDGPGYTGHVMDAQTGLTYMQQRYYDPQVGRFLSVDPVTADGSTGGNFNRYWYANNNPYKFTDPDGRQSKGADEVRQIATRLMSGIDSDATPATMSAGERVASGVIGAADVVFGGAKVATSAFGLTVAAASPVDGPIVDAAFGAKVAVDLMEVTDGVRGVLSAFDGKERPTSLEDIGGTFGGEEGAKIGKAGSVAISFTGAAKAIANPDGTIRGAVDAVKPLFEKIPDFEKQK